MKAVTEVGIVQSQVSGGYCTKSHLQTVQVINLSRNRLVNSANLPTNYSFPVQADLLIAKGDYFWAQCKRFTDLNQSPVNKGYWLGQVSCPQPGRWVDCSTCWSWCWKRRTRRQCPGGSTSLGGGKVLGQASPQTAPVFQSKISSERFWSDLELFKAGSQRLCFGTLSCVGATVKSSPRNHPGPVEFRAPRLPEEDWRHWRQWRSRGPTTMAHLLHQTETPLEKDSPADLFNESILPCCLLCKH